MLSAFRTVASFAQEPWEARRFGDGVHRHYVLNVKQAAADGVYFMSVSTFLMIMTWIIWKRVSTLLSEAMR